MMELIARQAARKGMFAAVDTLRAQTGAAADVVLEGIMSAVIDLAIADKSFAGAADWFDSIAERVRALPGAIAEAGADNDPA